MSKWVCRQNGFVRDVIIVGDYLAFSYKGKDSPALKTKFIKPQSVSHHYRNAKAPGLIEKNKTIILYQQNQGISLAMESG